MTDVTISELPLLWVDYDPPLYWHQPGHWAVRSAIGNPARQLAHHLNSRDYDLTLIDESLAQVDDLEAGRYRPGWFDGDNGGAVAYGNGYVLAEHDIYDDSQTVVTLETFRAALQWLRDLVAHPDFTNPEARFEPLRVEVVAHGAEAGDRYAELGGSFFVKTYD